MSEAHAIREHERFSFLDEAGHDRVADYLGKYGTDLGQDDKTSYYFVLSDANLSVATTSTRSVVKFKDGQIGQDVGYVEYPEVELVSEQDAERAVDLFSALTNHEPQVSSQFRRNYGYRGVEIALKYTETWGFHAELETTYSAGSDEERHDEAAKADRLISDVAGELGLQLASDDELTQFASDFKENGEPRGDYSYEEIKLLYDSLYKLAATRRLPKQQFMDEETIDWISANKPEDIGQPTDLLLSEAEAAVLEGLSLPESWFTDPARRTSLHGQLHLARVAALAAHIARYEGMSESDAHSLFVAGMVHDVMRIHDQEDPEHARASAMWFIANQEEIRREISDDQLTLNKDLIYEAIAFHDGDLDGQSLRYPDAVNYLRTADALDRYRQPKTKWWINDKYLLYKPDRVLKGASFINIVASECELLRSGSVTAATARIINK